MRSGGLHRRTKRPARTTVGARGRAGGRANVTSSGRARCRPANPSDSCRRPRNASHPCVPHPSPTRIRPHSPCRYSSGNPDRLILGSRRLDVGRDQGADGRAGGSALGRAAICAHPPTRTASTTGRPQRCKSIRKAAAKRKDSMGVRRHEVYQTEKRPARRRCARDGRPAEWTRGSAFMRRSARRRRYREA